MLLCTLFTKWGMGLNPVSSFLLSIIHFFSCQGNMSPQSSLASWLQDKKGLLQKSLLSSPPHPSLTTRRRKRGACSGRFVWRRCQVLPHVPGRLSGCAPLPPWASAPAGWDSSRPSAPGSGSVPGDKQGSWRMKYRNHALWKRHEIKHGSFIILSTGGAVAFESVCELKHPWNLRQHGLSKYNLICWKFTSIIDQNSEFSFVSALNQTQQHWAQ